MSGGAALAMMAWARSVLIQRVHQLARQILNTLEGAQRGVSTQRRSRGVCAKEGGRGRDNLPFNNGIVERDVMPFKTPPPRFFIAWLVKNAYIKKA